MTLPIQFTETQFAPAIQTRNPLLDSPVVRTHNELCTEVYTDDGEASFEQQEYEARLTTSLYDENA